MIIIMDSEDEKSYWIFMKVAPWCNDALSGAGYIFDLNYQQVCFQSYFAIICLNWLPIFYINPLQSLNPNGIFVMITSDKISQWNEGTLNKK